GLVPDFKLHVVMPWPVRPYSAGGFSVTTLNSPTASTGKGRLLKAEEKFVELPMIAPSRWNSRLPLWLPFTVVFAVRDPCKALGVDFIVPLPVTPGTSVMNKAGLRCSPCVISGKS